VLLLVKSSGWKTSPKAYKTSSSLYLVSIDLKDDHCLILVSHKADTLDVPNCLDQDLHLIITKFVYALNRDMTKL